MVAELADTSSQPRLKTILAALDPQPLLDATLMRLCRWMAEYYLCSFADALTTALPGSLRMTVERIARLAGDGDGSQPTLTETEQAILSSLAANGAQKTARLVEQFGTWAQRTLAALERKGLVRLTYELAGGHGATKRIRFYHAARLLGPDEEINTSHEHFYPNGNHEIRFGLSDIKYVSDNPTKEIIENRPYTNLYDFIVKTRSRAVTSRVITALISVGAFDRIEPHGRVKLLTIFNSFWEQKKQIKIAEKLKQLWDDCSKIADSLPGLETTKEKMIEFEKEYFGFKFFTSPFTDDRVEIIKKLEEKKLVYYKLADVREASRKVPICLNAIRSFNDKNGNEMAFIEVEDLGGSRLSVPIFQSFYKFIKDQLVVNELYLMNLYLDNKDKILFGRSGWTDDEYTIRRMIKKI